jgi:hypothetical protein
MKTIFEETKELNPTHWMYIPHEYAKPETDE